MEIKVDQAMRPCTVRTNSGGLNALFHGFFVYKYVRKAILQGDASGQEAHAMAIVELDNGQVNLVNAHDVKFLDSEEKFSEFAWTESDA